MPLRIGNVAIAHPFIQAALSGYSDLPMRRVARAHGAAYTINEVVLDKSVLHISDWQRRLLAVEPDDHPVAAQLMGATPEHFGPAARLLADAGYDAIDINFGCPAPKVLGRCRAGYLLGEPQTALEIVRRVLDAVGADRPVTLKMRRGLDDHAASAANFFRILDGAFALGVSAVTVHGRTVEQKYRGPSNWDFLAQAKRHAGDRLIFGSGDLFTAGACVAMLERTGVDAVTIARGALGNPWIFRECLALWRGEPPPAPPSLAEQRRVLEQHFAEAERVCGAVAAGKQMSKFGIRYASVHPNPKRVRAAFNGATSPEQFRAVLDAWYASDADTPLGVPPRFSGGVHESSVQRRSLISPVQNACLPAE